MNKNEIQDTSSQTENYIVIYPIRRVRFNHIQNLDIFFQNAQNIIAVWKRWDDYTFYQLQKILISILFEKWWENLCAFLMTGGNIRNNLQKEIPNLKLVQLFLLLDTRSIQNIYPTLMKYAPENMHYWQYATPEHFQELYVALKDFWLQLPPELAINYQNIPDILKKI